MSEKLFNHSSFPSRHFSCKFEVLEAVEKEATAEFPKEALCSLGKLRSTLVERPQPAPSPFFPWEQGYESHFMSQELPHPHKVGSRAAWESVHSQQCLLQSEISICDLHQWEHGAFNKVNHSRSWAICAFCSLPGRVQRAREIVMVRLL